MITAKQLFDKMLEENDECTSTEIMIEFAKIHTILLKEKIELLEEQNKINETIIKLQEDQLSLYGVS